MTLPPFEILSRAKELGLELNADDDNLLVCPGSRCPPDFAALLKQHKPELLDFLNRPPCPGWQAVPPSGLPLGSRPVMPGTDARRVMSFITRQLNGTDPLCEWCLKREYAYWLKFGWPDDVCALAAARDAACFQLKRTQADALTTLAGFSEA